MAPPPISAAAVPDAVPRAETIGAAGNTSPYRVLGKTYHVLKHAEGYRAQGLASWYGLKFHGRQTANGERFSVYAPTAAHRSLPIPSYVRVTNLENGREMTVRINDRGPFHPDRIIDLSYGAAVKLGFADKGTAEVLIEALTVPAEKGDIEKTSYTMLQLGAFSREERARALQQRAHQLLQVPVVVSRAFTEAGNLFRLKAGPFASVADLEKGQQQLVAAGLPKGQPVP